MDDSVAEDNTNSEDSIRVKKCPEQARAVGQEKNKRARVYLTVLDYGIMNEQWTIDLLINSGVQKTLVSEKDWDRLQNEYMVKHRSQLKVKQRKFLTRCTLPILGWIKCHMRAQSGKVGQGDDLCGRKGNEIANGTEGYRSTWHTADLIGGKRAGETSRPVA